MAKSHYRCYPGKRTLLVLAVMLIFLLSLSYAHADKVNAGDTDKYVVLNRGAYKIVIDDNFDDWKWADNILYMDEKTWEALGGSYDGPDDLSADFRVLWDESNLYFALQVKDDTYIAQGANPWENDGPQMAIDSSAGKIPAGWPNTTTHLYNFSIKDGWQKETGPFLGDAEIQMKRDDSTKQTLFEWKMPVEIFAKKGTTLKAGQEIAFAIIINDSDKNAPGQTGWIGWGNHTIVFGKNPEEMQTLVLSAKTMAVESQDKLAVTWGLLKK